MMTVLRFLHARLRYARLRGSPLAVLAYHGIAPLDRVGDDLYTVTVRNFQAQVRMLTSWFSVISGTSLDIEASKPRVLITFDDGLADNFAHAFPILKAAGAPAVFFISTGLADTPGYLTWEQVRTMAGAGMLFGSHGVLHRDFGSLSESEARNELTESQRALTQQLGRPAELFAYPFGKERNMREDDRPILAACGYRYAFAFGGGAQHRVADPLRIPRMMAVDVTAPTLLHAIITSCAGARP
jgi:peptidoglycan/xylan/chitin deacetylase (PgdA/CDA1 family)